MKIAELLAPQYVLAELKGESKPQILQELAKALVEGQKEVGPEEKLELPGRTGVPPRAAGAI